MKKIFLLNLTLSLFSTNCFWTQNDSELNSEIDSVSYIVGTNIAQNILNDFPEINLISFLNGISDKMDKQKSPRINDEAAKAILQSYFTKKQEVKNEEMKKSYESVIKKGEDFLATNGKRKEVTTLKSGLQYEIINKGNGAKPTLTDKVKTHYHGTLLDGSVFDSSVERGEPISFPVNGVIPGWTEALQLMPTGSKWKLFVPYHLAYGERGAGQKIGPYSTLIFEVELINIEK